MSSQESDVLRCWRCRKYIANSNCLAKCHGKEPSDVSIMSVVVVVCFIFCLFVCFYFLFACLFFPVPLVLNRGELLDLPSLNFSCG